MRLMTPAEVARKGNVTPDAVRRWADEGKLAAFRTSTGWRLFSEDAVTDFLRQRGNRTKDTTR